MKNSKSVLKWLFLIAAAVYVFAVIKLTFVKDGIRLETDEYRAVLFSGINEYKAGLKSFESLMLNYAGNVAMFLPLGIFLPVFFKKLTFWKTVWLGFLFSSMIELLQYSMSSGYMDVDDIITNTLGAALGADGVSVGRELMKPLKNGGQAVADRIREMTAELASVMARTGVKDLSSFDPTVLHFWNA